MRIHIRMSSRCVPNANARWSLGGDYRLGTFIRLCFNVIVLLLIQLQKNMNIIRNQHKLQIVEYDREPIFSSEDCFGFLLSTFDPLPSDTHIVNCVYAVARFDLSVGYVVCRVVCVRIVC